MKNDFSIVGVIPARYASERLPHKLLRKICGKTLLQWTWENASSSHMLDRLIIACDHPDVEDVAKEFGAEVINTAVEHFSGTDRLAEAVNDIDTKIVINIQADEPLIHPLIIDNLAQEMLSNPDIVMATVKKKITDDNEINNPNVVKVVCDKSDFAIYFSRFSLPYFRKDTENIQNDKIYYKHLGIYAYNKEFLYIFKNLPKSYLEKAEKLEQLRALEAGYKIKVIETQFDSCGVDTEEDLQQVKRILLKKRNV
ncbi:MAG: 3-deoxy-manno-octulosonate cytidylyltransferase [Candidatus Omnitrophica bacterium]|nr:3-deoxy-manno-octulosonate cytidylyltransferase [Candidatus Omnitrophota bacterium]